MTAIASGGEDKKVMVWDVESKKCIQKYDCFDSAITKTIFHPAEQCVITATKSKDITMHDVRT
jgi:WD40 repeat protein